MHSMSSPSSSTAPPAPSRRRKRQTITDQSQVDKAQEDCQINSGNNVISCFPTADTVVPQHQWASFVWNSRRPELTQTNLVDIFLFRADSQQQLLHFPQHPNPTDRAGVITAQVNDTWFGTDGLKFQGANISFPYFWVIIRSDASISNGNFIPQPIFTAVQTAQLDSIASPTAALSSSIPSPSSPPPTGLPSSLRTTTTPSSSSTTPAGGNVQHASSASSFPRWAIAVIVVLGFFAIAATCILVFVILRRLRRRQQQRSSSSAAPRNSMGSASPMMPRDHSSNNNPDMIQRYDSPGSPLLAPAALHQHPHHTGTTTHDAASAISDTGGPFSGADAAIMADAFRKMLRKPDFAARPVEEGESPDQPEDALGLGGESREEDDAGEQVLRGQLAEEGRDIRSVSSSRGVKVESHQQELDPGETR